MNLLAIETSCDETAVSLFDLQAFLDGCEIQSCLQGQVLASSANLHMQYGGVVPELAAREQTLTLPPLVKEILAENNIFLRDLRVIAVTAGPGLNGSLLVGLSFAKALAYGLNIPLIPINHLEGHLAAQQFLPRAEQLKIPFLTLLVSGGHTEVILHSSATSQRTVAKTRDDAAGEAFDKCATLLGLPYPGGPALSDLAKLGNPRKYDLPISLPGNLESFSFSGFKTAVSILAKKELSKTTEADLAASIQFGIVQALVDKSIALAKKHNATGIFLTGGVAANSYLRTELSERCKSCALSFQVAPLELCTDNAIMIGVAALGKIAAQPDRFLKWAPSAGEELGPGVSLELGSKPTWPVSSV